MNTVLNKIEFEQEGYFILSNIYTENEINTILSCIENTKQNKNSFLKTKDLFAIRKLIKTIPELSSLICNKNLKKIISNFSESEYFITKAIYFDKPSTSNWFVPYHQDFEYFG